MFQTVTDKFQPAEGTITINGIPYPEYQLYFYVYPDSGGGGERGGYFTLTAGDGTVHTRWLKGGTGPNTTIPLPDPATGSGYVLSTTSIQPATFGDVQAGHYVVISGLTDANVMVRYTAVGAGAGGVSGGDGTRRLKVSGFQIVETIRAPVTSLALASPIPGLYAGNPAGYGVQVLATHSDGSTQPLNNLEGATYASSNTAIFTVTSQGVVQPLGAGSAQIEVAFGNLSLSETVTVLRPDRVRPSVAVDPLYVGATEVQIALVADFSDGAVDVNVTKFLGVTFSGGPAGVVEVTAEGLLAAVGAGSYRVGATYAGVSGQADPAGTALPYTPPQPDGGRVAISFNLHSGNRMLFNDLAGAPGVRVGYWNNVSGLTGSRNAVVLAAGAVRDSAGRVSGLSAEITGGTSGAGASTRGSQTGHESTMFNGVYDQYNGIPGVIALRGLPFATYDAYFYALSGDADNRVGHFTIGAETRWLVNSRGIPIPDNDGFGYVESQTTTAPTSVFEVDPGNYVKFSNLTGSSLDIAFAADGSEVVFDSDGAPRLKFAGFQLVGVLAPALRLTWKDPGHLRLAWPAAAQGYTLKSSTALGGAWTTVNLTPTLEGNELTVTLPTDGARAFYVLEKP
ncbi:MAG: hypothetical protein FJ387_05485 [Verrucomicrobia bacterium]|nr:hypothetical protein [Verrucomicrobiota bacterium]